MFKARRGGSQVLWAAVSILAALAVWEIVARWSGIPPFLIPPPGAVVARLVQSAAAGTLGHHVWVTLAEVLTGLAIGLSFALGLGYALAKSPSVERLISPYLVASQSVPVVALAPLLALWFGPGPTSKVLISALIVFFPALVNTVLGVRSVPTELKDLMRSLRASTWQTFAKLEVPASLPAVFSGLKVGATLSVIGAVVGEFVAANEGLGFLLNVARGRYDTPLVFGCILLLVGMALTLYGITSWFELRLLGWRTENPR
ncbi:MAG: ABC transporter permease [Anaerolineales bacterium]